LSRAPARPAALLVLTTLPPDSHHHAAGVGIVLVGGLLHPNEIGSAGPRAHVKRRAAVRVLVLYVGTMLDEELELEKKNTSRFAVS
jgi:hypothetical protein